MSGPELVIADYSQYQGVVHPSSTQVVIIRAHNGYTPDPYFEANRAAAHAAGCPAVGLYQYLAPDRDAGVQAAELLHVIGRLAANEWLICDLESGGGDQQPRWQNWRTVIRGAIGWPPPWLYSDLAFAEAHDLDPQWVAAYGPNEPTLPHKLWQDTDAYPWPWGPSDASIFHGTLPQFLTAVGIALPGPVVPAKPKEPQPMPPFVAHTTAGAYIVDVPTRLVAKVATPASGSSLTGPAPAGLGWPYVAVDADTLRNIATGTPIDQIV